MIQRLNKERGRQETLYKAHGDDPNLTVLEPLLGPLPDNTRLHP